MNFLEYVKILTYDNNKLLLEEMELCRIIPMEPACLPYFFDIFLMTIDKSSRKGDIILNKKQDVQELWVEKKYEQYYTRNIIKCAYMRCNKEGINVFKGCYYKRTLKECIDKLSNVFVKNGTIHTIVPFDGEYVVFESDYPKLENDEIEDMIDNILIKEKGKSFQKTK